MMSRPRGFTLIELLVVIAIIAVLMAVLMPSLQAAKQLASSSACLANEKTLLTAWIMYADDNNGSLVSNRACYDAPGDEAPWVHRPKNGNGNSRLTGGLVAQSGEIGDGQSGLSKRRWRGYWADGLKRARGLKRSKRHTDCAHRSAQSGQSGHQSVAHARARPDVNVQDNEQKAQSPTKAPRGNH
ncbi:MAG: type II secretion system protein [Planctomycetes bacterium]|nr:type II secretion system protein [Planctomycetota bacterium]